MPSSRVTRARATALATGLLFGACDGGAVPGSPAALAMELNSMGIRNKAMSEDLTVMTAGQLTEDQFEQMGRFGFERLICLREASEAGTGWEEALAKKHMIDFVRLPIRGSNDLTKANAEKLAAAIAAGSGGVVVYCGSSDRVGGLLALKATLVDGKPHAQAMAIGKHHGMNRTEAAIEKVLSGG